MIKKNSIHIVDDHQIIIDGISAVINLEDDLEVVGTSNNGQEAIDWLKENHTDILLLDINMPVCNGMEVLKELENFKDKPKVIVLTSYDDFKTIKDTLELGADGFLPKKNAGRNVIKVVRSILNGEN